MTSAFMRQLPNPDVRAVSNARLVLVEDDLGDAVLVQALLEDAAEQWNVEWVPSIERAREALVEPAVCVLVDLGLPDARDLEALTAVLEVANDAAVIVLTGLDDARRGLEAVAAGAQDYLVKGAIDGAALSRAVRYAIERKQAEETTRRLREATLQRRENARLERGLLPKPLLRTNAVELAMRYRPGGGRLELGGDFYDVVELEDGRVRVIIGDVSGHGPDEAAIGVVLRAAWRALVLAEQEPTAILSSLQVLLESERSHDEVFVTCCDITIDVANGEAWCCVAGHPSPLVFDGHQVSTPELPTGPALGLVDDARWQLVRVELAHPWSLLVFTDGLIEGHVGGAAERLGVEGLLRIIHALCPQAARPQQFVDDVVTAVEAENAAPLADDTAVLFIRSGAAR